MASYTAKACSRPQKGESAHTSVRLNPSGRLQVVHLHLELHQSACAGNYVYGLRSGLGVYNFTDASEYAGQ